MSDEFELEALPGELRGCGVELALVLGSGLGSFVDRLEVEATLGYDAVEGLPASSVPGHAGRFVVGQLGGRRLLVAQGRAHLYEGHSPQAVTAGVRLMAALGVKRLVLTNAAGVLNESFAVGEWMMISDHLNLSGATPLQGGANFFDMSDVYSAAWRAEFRKAAAAGGMTLREGVYACMPGPQYETPAEVRMLRTLGGDAVGMSTAPEAIQATALGLEVAGFSCLTNWAAGLSDEPLSHDEVMEAGVKAAASLVDLLVAVLG